MQTIFKCRQIIPDLQVFLGMVSHPQTVDTRLFSLFAYAAGVPPQEKFSELNDLKILLKILLRPKTCYYSDKNIHSTVDSLVCRFGLEFTC